MTQSKEASRYVESVLSALDIVDCFQYSPELTLKELIDHTGLTRSRAMRLTGTLESRGYLVGNPDTRTYYPGMKWPTIAKSFERINQVEELIRPVLIQLARQTEESATYYVRQGTERVALVREEGDHSIRYVIREGESYRLIQGGAAGRVLLGFGPSPWQELLAGEDIDSAFIQGVEQTKAQGYAISRGENTLGACSISAPVYKEGDALAGALTISGPESRLDEQRLGSMVELVVDTAHFLSERLGAPTSSLYNNNLNVVKRGSMS